MVRAKWLAALVLSSLFTMTEAKAEVWKTTRSWDDVAEAEFSEWIKRVPMDVFTSKNSKYSGISTDCADAAYALRVIFAYERGLPVDFPSGKNLTNDNNDFDSVEAGLPRLKKFIQYVRNQTNTRTLIEDTYPVAINRKTIRPGAMFLHPLSGPKVPVTYRSGHVYYIQNVFENGMIRYFSSTVPAMVRDLTPRIEIVFAPQSKEGGYRAWRRAGSSETPGSSEEQFKIGGWRANAYGDTDLWAQWARAVRKRLQLREATAGEELNANIENVRGAIKERVNLVRKGWNMFQTKYGGHKCFNENDYDDLSTPTRDVKLQTELQYLRESAIKYLRSQGYHGSESELQQLYSNYEFEVVPGRRVDLNHLWTTFMTEIVLAVSEPEHSPAVRWGLEYQGLWICPHRAKQYVGGHLVAQ